MTQESAPEVTSSAQGPTAEPSSGNTRRGLLVGVGVLGVAGVAAACGGGDDGGDDAGQVQPEGGGTGAGTGAGNEQGGGGQAGGAQLIAKVGAIPVGSGRVFKKKKVVVTQPTKGQFKAFDIKCTHRGCDVGKVQGDKIVCPCHNSTFSIADGSVTGGPAKEPLAAKEIKVTGKRITLA